MAHHIHFQRISHGIPGIFIVIAVCSEHCCCIATTRDFFIWLNRGGDLRNTRSAWEEKLIGPSTVGNLRLRWKFFAGKDISATPAVANVVVYCSAPIVSICGPVVVIAVNRSNGRLVWSTQLDPHPRAVITTSRTAYLGGSLVKLNILPGAILWQTYTLPDNGGELRGYDGACIWGSSPAIDPKRRLAYVATGNHYTAPAKVQECQARQNNQTIPPTAPDQCIGPDVNFNSIIAFEMESGRIRWAPQLGGSDADHDPHDIAVVVQMSGFAWAVDHDSRDIVWFRVSNGKRVYINTANGNRKNFTLAPSTQTTTAGAWVALDGRSGEVLWSTANPSNEMAPTPVSVANGVMFACSVAPEGPVFAMDAETGKILRSYNSGATVYGGISISYGCIYHGNGYKLGL
ncbi:hypothetical protein EUGRSUZ_G02529 [Eucalyptus grandis]|uniref:Pyrrolo-quinoline quinone repeat domain-containing protein n=2 Tax=Eucalyptus grandis TaxID=71139 RepID=A0A059BH51_EUCGR|nr:hypothetical protein EUGRSUZ_G02529 [Eucalyptus grandis]